MRHGEPLPSAEINGVENKAEAEGNANRDREEVLDPASIRAIFLAAWKDLRLQTPLNRTKKHNSCNIELFEDDRRLFPALHCYGQNENTCH